MRASEERVNAVITLALTAFHLLAKLLLTPSLRHCSNKYKLAREGEKDKDEDFEKVNNHIFDKERCSLGLI